MKKEKRRELKSLTTTIHITAQCHHQYPRVLVLKLHKEIRRMDYKKKEILKQQIKIILNSIGMKKNQCYPVPFKLSFSL